jgi:hypothetical protein
LSLIRDNTPKGGHFCESFIGEVKMNKLNEVFTPSKVSRGKRHIVKGQIVQGDSYQVEDVRRAFWSNPDGTHSAHLFRLKKGEVVDRVTVDSWEGESLNQFALRTESIILGGA